MRERVSQSKTNPDHAASQPSDPGIIRRAFKKWPSAARIGVAGLALGGFTAISIPGAGASEIKPPPSATYELMHANSSAESAKEHIPPDLGIEQWPFGKGYIEFHVYPGSFSAASGKGVLGDWELIVYKLDTETGAYKLRATTKFGWKNADDLNEFISTGKDGLLARGGTYITEFREVVPKDSGVDTHWGGGCYAIDDNGHVQRLPFYEDDIPPVEDEGSPRTVNLTPKVVFEPVKLKKVEGTKGTFAPVP